MPPSEQSCFTKLSDDLFYDVAEYLDKRDLCRLSATCKSLNDILLGRRRKAARQCAVPADEEYERIGNEKPAEPMLRCILESNIAALRLFLDAGVDPNSRAVTHRSPMFLIAVDKLKYKSASLLLEYGADPNLADKNGKVPFDLIDRLRCPDIVPTLADFLNKAGCKNVTRLTSFAVICRYARLDTVKDLLDIGTDILSLRGNHGITVFHELARHGSLSSFVTGTPRTLDLLIELSPALLNVANENGHTALHYAMTWREPDYALYLLEKGIRVGRPDKDGRTELWWAVHVGQERIVREILARPFVNYSVDRNHEQANLNNPLTEAARWRRWDTLKLLLRDSRIQVDSSFISSLQKDSRFSDRYSALEKMRKQMELEERNHPNIREALDDVITRR
ncbi:ankyrin repeat-containing domain protein [Aspergillus alliaceus]|uniref:Ankyrin repeat-containing domain protein n=1 Tax=Petromyces alliaceus TaxID=209559 RepID=A0A5N7BWH5_PETAA|nr:ankyrin repeat-containing domain protein [Aspergillus alliaceus]